MSNGENCTTGVRNEQKIISLEERMKEVENAVIDMRDNLLKRPSWAVTVVITFLSSACVGLLMQVLK